MATPQDNGHIESYYHTVKKAVSYMYEFFDLQEANEIIQKFVHFYNGERLHSGIRYLKPNQYFFRLGLNRLPHYQDNTLNWIIQRMLIYTNL